MIMLSADRVRSLISDCHTEQDITLTLRRHGIKHSFTSETGYTSIRIPCRKGTIRIYRVCSRSAPFVVRAGDPIPFSFLPKYHTDN